MNSSKNFLLFGATGSIGTACEEQLRLSGNVVGGSRDLEELASLIESISRFDSVIWAHGINSTDSAGTFQIDSFENIMNANVTYILSSLKVLLDKRKIQANSQLVVVSSLWSQLSRPNKLSYGISKSAVSGLIRSLAVDLGPLGIQINGVSPGPIATPMTIANLKPEELERVISESPLKRLVNLREVASVVCELATGKLSGVTGQEIIIDSGWSVSKLV